MNHATMWSVRDGSPIPRELLRATPDEIRAWLNVWLMDRKIDPEAMGWKFKDDRDSRGLLGTCGYYTEGNWEAAVGFTGIRMILPVEGRE